MVYIGAIALVCATFMIWREYSSYLGGELAVCRSFLAAVCSYREGMRCYLSGPAEWAGGYEDEHLEECGFLVSLREGAGFKNSYAVCRDKLCSSDELDAILTALFERIGDGYLDAELEIISAAIEKLTELESRLNGDLPRKRKAVGAMLGAFVLGIVILII